VHELRKKYRVLRGGKLGLLPRPCLVGAFSLLRARRCLLFLAEVHPACCVPSGSVEPAVFPWPWQGQRLRRAGIRAQPLPGLQLAGLPRHPEQL